MLPLFLSLGNSGFFDGGEMITSPVYATREQVKAALDSKESARNNLQIDRAIESASRSIESLTHRKFYPELTTRYFDWPDFDNRGASRLWLNADEVVSVSSLIAGGTTIVAADYFLEPVNTGPPYNRVEIDLSSNAAFNTGQTYQRNIAITGVFAGCALNTAVAGAVAEALDATETGVDVSDSSLIGIGDLILIDSERMLVTDKQMLTTAQTLQTPVNALASDVTIAVTNGSVFNVGEIILLDAERMLIVDIAGNNLVVKRAWDGTVLASHTGSTIFALRTLVVVRGVLGTTITTHNTSTAITRHVYPALIRELCIAEALNNIQQESSAYARTIGSGDNLREMTGAGLDDLRTRVYSAYGRKVRMRVV